MADRYTVLHVVIAQFTGLTISVELTWAAHCENGLARIALVGAERARGTFGGESGGIRKAKREVVLPAAPVVAQARAVAERRRVAVGLELKRASFEALIRLGARLAKGAVVSGVCAESP